MPSYRKERKDILQRIIYKALALIQYKNFKLGKVSLKDFQKTEKLLDSIAETANTP